jgi:cobalt-zinc-cadmium efflux system membrane fusion protein
MSDARRAWFDDQYPHQKNGAMRSRRATGRLLALVPLFAAQCGSEPSSAPRTPAGPAEQFSYATAVGSTFRVHQPALGQVVVRREVTLRATRAGRVAECPSEIGQSVGRGQVFLSLTGPRIEGPRRILSRNIEVLREAVVKARADVERLTNLHATNVVSERDKRLVAAEAALGESKLAVSKAEDELEAFDLTTTILVPVDGRITELHVRDGTDVEENEPVAVLSVPSDVAIEAAVVPRRGLRPRVGLGVDVFLEPAPASPIALKVDYLLPTADVRTGFPIAGILPGPLGKHLRIDQRVKIELIGEEMPVVVVPASAVVSRAGKTYCLRRAATGWQAAEVTVAGSDGAGNVYLAEGISAGDEVLSEGAYGLIYRDFRELFSFED